MSACTTIFVCFEGKLSDIMLSETKPAPFYKKAGILNKIGQLTLLNEKTRTKFHLYIEFGAFTAIFICFQGQLSDIMILNTKQSRHLE